MIILFRFVAENELQAMSHAESIRNAIAETYCCRSNTAAKLTQLDLDTFF